MPCDKSVKCPWRHYATVKQNANKSGMNGMKFKLNKKLRDKSTNTKTRRQIAEDDE